jgi:hypothetical protein
MPRSVLRHRPINPDSDIQTWAVVTPTIPRSHRRSPASLPPPFFVGLGMSFTLLILCAWLCISAWGSAQLDTLRYGYPRTFQVDRAVGHEVERTTSHFIATNDHGQIYVLEIPGGNPSHSHLLLGPHLIGPSAELAPVILDFQGNPQHPDLLVEVFNTQTRFLNTGATYVHVASQ